MSGIIIALIGIIPSTAAAVIAYHINRKSDKRYEEQRQDAKDRAEIESLQMKMITASASLGYACAMALKRGETNGEVESAVADYAIAKKEYLEYINRGFFEYKEGAK